MNANLGTAEVRWKCKSWILTQSRSWRGRRGGGGGGGWVGWKHFFAVTLYNLQRKGAKFPQLLPLGGPCKTKTILFLTTEKQSGWNKKKYTRLDPELKPESHFVLLNTNTFSLGTCSEPASQVIWRANELAINWQMRQLQAVQSRHSKLYCLCNRDIQNFIVWAIETFITLLFVQPRHTKLYCLCNRDIQNFIACATETYETLLFLQSSHSKLYCLRVPSGAPYIYIVCSVSTVFRIKFLREMKNAYNHKNHKTTQKRFTNNILEYLL